MKNAAKSIQFFACKFVNDLRELIKPIYFPLFPQVFLKTSEYVFVHKICLRIWLFRMHDIYLDL